MWAEQGFDSPTSFHAPEAKRLGKGLQNPLWSVRLRPGAPFLLCKIKHQKKPKYITLFKS